MACFSSAAAAAPRGSELNCVLHTRDLDGTGALQQLSATLKGSKPSLKASTPSLKGA
jgi:hypothetical protein